MGSNPACVYIIFSYVESNNIYHLCVFGLITDLKQAKNVLGNLMVFRLNLERGELCFKNFKKNLIPQVAQKKRFSFMISPFSNIL